MPLPTCPGQGRLFPIPRPFAAFGPPSCAAVTSPSASVMKWDGDPMDHACGAFLMGNFKVEACLSSVIDIIGWRWGFVVLSYCWLGLLTVVQGTLVRLCCGRLRPVEQGLAMREVLGNMWRVFVFVNVVLAPKDVREWLFWMLWFSSAGLLTLLQKVGRAHFEHVVENPRFGVFHHVRTLALHAIVLYLGIALALIGWGEFVEWGEGPIGRVLLSPPPMTLTTSWMMPSSSSSSSSSMKCHHNEYGLFGEDGECGGAESGDAGGVDVVSMSTDPARGGTGFALLLLYDLAVCGTDLLLSAIKYIQNLLELHKDADSAYNEDGWMEQITFFTQLGQAIMLASRSMYMFQSCGHCALGRRMLIRFLTFVNGAHTLRRVHRAALRVLLAREMDVTFPDASEQELKNMPGDESCAICLKTLVKSVKRLKCQHFYHTGCLRQYLNNTAGHEPLCPICRAVIPWHPCADATKRPSRTQVGSGGERGPAPANPPNGAADAAATTTAPTNYTADTTPVVARDARNGLSGDGDLPSPLTFGPGVHRPRTPDGFSRAARGVDSAVRMVREVLWFGPPWGRGGGVAAAGAGAAAPGRQDASISTAAPEGHGRGERSGGSGSGGDGGAAGVGGGFEAVAHQLLEIFPDMERDAALAAARLANGSAELAVEYALSSGNSRTGFPSRGTAAAAGRR